MSSDKQKSLLYCSLLALQFGLQPMIASRFTASGVSKSSVVIATELGKILIAIFTFVGESSTERQKIIETWSFKNSLMVAALPATLYAIQNVLVQHGYQLLDSMTFNLLNQTKTLSAAFWLWVVMGKPQSVVQVFALLLLLLAAIVLNMGFSGFGMETKSMDSNYQLGLVMVAGASMLSGLSAALTQKTLVSKSNQRHPILFSAELAIYGILFLIINMVFNSDIKGGWLFSNWDAATLIPVTTNAFGGVVVGLVTKYAGGVVKGFALIAGILITGLAQWIVEGKPLGGKDLVGVILVSMSIYLHSSFPIRTIVGKERKD